MTNDSCTELGLGHVLSGECEPMIVVTQNQCVTVGAWPDPARHRTHAIAFRPPDRYLWYQCGCGEIIPAHTLSEPLPNDPNDDIDEFTLILKGKLCSKLRAEYTSIGLQIIDRWAHRILDAEPDHLADMPLPGDILDASRGRMEAYLNDNLIAVTIPTYWPDHAWPVPIASAKWVDDQDLNLSPEERRALAQRIASIRSQRVIITQ